MNGFQEIIQNPVLIPTFVSWFLAQFIKVIYHWIADKKLGLGWFFATGGMPSSHSAYVCALATVVGMYQGYDSLMFGIACVFAFIVMFDAVGVRRATGEQAMAINQIFDEIRKGDSIDFKPMKEILGHRPIEVLFGAILGISIAYLSYIVL